MGETLIPSGALFEIGFHRQHYSQGGFGGSTPPGHTNAFREDAPELEAVFPFPVRVDATGTGYGIGASGPGELIQVLAGPEVQAALNVVQIAGLAAATVGYFLKKLGGSRFFVSRKIAEGLCLNDAFQRLGTTKLEIAASHDIPAGKYGLLWDAGIRNLEARTYMVAIRDTAAGGKVLVYAIRSRPKDRRRDGDRD